MDFPRLLRALPQRHVVDVRWEDRGPVARVLIDQEDRGDIGESFLVMSGTHRFRLSLPDDAYRPGPQKRAIESDDEVVFTPVGG